MKKYFLFLFSALILSSYSFSQGKGEKVFEYIVNCSDCREIIVISGTIEKKYVGIWFDSKGYENGFLTFKKGATIHRWNLDNVVFIEQNNAYIRIYLEQTS
tara:strand:+ start:898 stop:1200 length:303 start_codon:yes stop_codon:yes gene_type:complete